jgi:ferredoxin
MEIVADLDKCAGYGMCETMAPDFFEVRDDDGTVLVLDTHPGTEHRDHVHAAVAACPMLALRVQD